MKICLFSTLLVLGFCLTSTLAANLCQQGFQKIDSRGNDCDNGEDQEVVYNVAGFNITVKEDGNDEGNGNDEENESDEEESAPVCDKVERDAEFPEKFKKYRVFPYPKTWYQADLYCKTKCMVLATAMSPKDQVYLETAVNTHSMNPWLGGLCSTNRNCRWQNTRAYINTQYQNWGPHEPETLPHGDNGEMFNCVAFNAKTRQWALNKCGDKKPFVCQYFIDY